jgi:hypothetical protein
MWKGGYDDSHAVAQVVVRAMWDDEGEAFVSPRRTE